MESGLKPDLGLIPFRTAILALDFVNAIKVIVGVD